MEDVWDILLLTAGILSYVVAVLNLMVVCSDRRGHHKNEESNVKAGENPKP